jgi:hypothetical protein
MLKETAIGQLLSIKYMLNQMKDEDYHLPLTTLKGSSIGRHIRHILEFYECLFFSGDNKTVNYDDRKRNILLEENMKYALDYISEIMDILEAITTNSRILLIANYQKQSVNMESSLYREITYNIEHTVHHLAIIGIAIPIHFQYIILPENFGYADSTLQYLKTQSKVKQ